MGVAPVMHPPYMLSMVQYPVTSSRTDKPMLHLPQHQHDGSVL